VSPQDGLPFGRQSERADAIGGNWLDALPPQADCLRDYQLLQVAEIAAAIRGSERRLLVQLPTGGGKTHEISAITAAASAARLRVVILATRTRLVRQIHERLEAFGIMHGVIAASLPELRNYSALVQVASADTLYRRALVDGKHPLPSADVVIFDEAHLATAKSRQQLLDSYPTAIRIGFTATPARKSGRSLGTAFERIIRGPSIRELVAAGMLVPSRIFASPLVTQQELRALPTDNENDFAVSALGELISRPKLVGDVVTNWLRIAAGKRTIIFAVNKGHAAALLESFRHQGIAAEMLTDQDDEATREEVIGRLETGETLVLVNCFLLSYGTDLPTVECIVLARPTRSLTMYLQMVGRGLRTAPGKSHCILIDHGHVVENLGLPTADHEWTLDPARNINTETLRAQSRRKPVSESIRTCPECSHLWLVSEEGNACKCCGWAPLPRSRQIAVEDADLEELTDGDRPDPRNPGVMRFHAEACGWYVRRWPDRWRAKPNSGRWWAWIATRERFKFPEVLKMPPAYWNSFAMPPSVETDGWLKHRLIRWAKSKARAAA